MKNYKNFKKLIIIFFVPCIFFPVYIFGGFQIYYVDGFSMFPTFRENDILICKSVKLHELNLYDVIAFYPISWDIVRLRFQYPLPLICHRIIDIQMRNGSIWFKTAGDFHHLLNFPDPDIPFFAVKGKVILSIPIEIIIVFFGIIFGIFCILIYTYKNNKEKIENEKI